MERRFFRGRKVQLRAAAADGQPAVVSGLGIVYNSETVIGGWFRESIAPGAAKTAIGMGSDIRCLFNHDANHVIGRTAAGTMRLADGDDGVTYEADVNPDDPDACSVAAKIGRGDVTGSSFSFLVKSETWTDPDPGTNQLPLRTINEYAEILDIGPVTFPAYEDTTSEARDKAKAILARVRPPAPALEVRDVPQNVSTEKADPDTAWSKPNLSDFTSKTWAELSTEEKNNIAGHYAWRGGDAFADLSLPHHRASDGDVVLKGVQAAAARLDETEGINKSAVQAHLEAHYHAFGEKAPWESDANSAQTADEDRQRRLRLARARR